MRRGTLPTAFRISHYLTGVLLLSCVIVLFQDLRVGLAYLAATVGILIPLHLYRVPDRFYYTVLLASGTVWLTHLIRPLVLSMQPEDFLYPRITAVNEELVTSALLRIAVMGFMLLSGLVLGYRIWGKLPTGRLEEATGREDEPGEAPLLFRMRTVVTLGLVFAVAFKAVFLLAFGVGFRSGEPNPILSIIGRFLPDYLIYGLVVLYLAKYHRAMRPPERWLQVGLLVAMGALGLLQGSKAFLAQILLALFVFYLAFRGDFRIRLGRAAVLAAAGLVVLAVSFPMAMSLRRHVQTDGYDMGAVPAMVEGLVEMARPDQAAFLSAWISSRFIGFDGVLAIEARIPPELLQVFAFAETVERVQGRLIPLDRGAGSISSGRAVSTYLIGHPEDLRHSGGVGLFAASRLMGGPVGGVGIVFLFGLGWALYFCLVERMRSGDARFLLRYVGVNGIIFWTMSGNADYLAPILVITVAEILVLNASLKPLYSVLR